MQIDGDGNIGNVNGGEPLGSCLCSFSDEGSTESHRYYLSRRTVLEMLKDRGYSVPASEINLSLQEFRDIHSQNPDFDRLRFSASHLTDPSKRVMHCFREYIIRGHQFVKNYSH